MAVKKYGAADKVAGFDTDKRVLDFALSEGIIDEHINSLNEENDSGLIVIATYVDKISDILREIIPHLNEGAVVTDVGSVKANIVRSADELTGGKVSFVGSHPIAGKENPGIENSDPDLFQGCPVVITPTEASDRRAVDTVSKFWGTLGSRVISTTPGQHDKIFALVSHLPHVVAYTLINTVSSSDIEDIFSYSGGGLKDYTRIASSSPDMWKSIFMQNRDSVLDCIDKFKKNIELIESAIKNEDLNKLQSLLENARDAKLSE